MSSSEYDSGIYTKSDDTWISDVCRGCSQTLAIHIQYIQQEPQILSQIPLHPRRPANSFN